MFFRAHRLVGGAVCLAALAGSLGAWGCRKGTPAAKPTAAKPTAAKPAAARPAAARSAEPALTGYTKVALGEINASPRDFLHRKVCADCYFGGMTDLYQPFRTQFSREDYVNFTVWPVGAKLWLAAEHEASLPYFYVARDLGEIIERNPERLLRKLDAFKRFQPLTVYGTVVSDYNGAAWVAVDAFRTRSGVAFTPESIRRLQLATERFAAKQYALAAKDYRTALPLGVPAEAEGFIRRPLGLSLLALEDYAGAAAELAKAEKLGAANTESLIGLAEARIELGRFAEAESAARAALALEPRSILARARLAVALGHQQKFAEGLDECSDALRLGAVDADVLRAQGIVLGLAGKLDAAIEAYKQAVLARATDPRIQRELGQLYTQKGDFAKARDCFENVITLSKENTLGYCRGCCLLAGALEALKKPEEAVNCYLLAQKRDETYAPAYIGLGSLFANAGKDKEAIEQFMVVAEKLDPKGENGFMAWRRVAELHRAKSTPEAMAKAAEAYAKAAVIKPGDYPNWLDLANAYWEQPKPDLGKVEAALRRAAAIEPGKPLPHFLLGKVLDKMGKIPESALEFEEAKRRNPTDALTSLRLGQTYRRLGRDAEALKELEDALKLDAANADIKNSLAFALADAAKPQDLGRAERLATEAVAAKPGESAFQDTLGWVQAHTGKTGDAEATLEKAAGSSGEAPALYHLGWVYFANKKFDKAEGALSKAALKIRQGRMGCPSCKRLEVAIQEKLAEAKRENARVAKRPAEVKKPAGKPATK